MSDPYSIQSAGRLGGSLGGRARVVSSVSPVRRQKFTYPATAPGHVYGFTHAAAFAIRSLALKPTPNVNVDESINGFNSGASVSIPSIVAGGTYAPSGLFVGDGADAVAGDLLIASIHCLSAGGQTITPPAGWHGGTVVGAGTRPVLAGLYWKIATSGDVSGANVFALGVSVAAAAATGTIHAIRTGTFDASAGTDGVIATHDILSTGDATSSATGPDSDAIARPRAFIAEFSFLSSSDASSSVTVSSTTASFLNQANDGTGSVAQTQALGWRYIEPG